MIKGAHTSFTLCNIHSKVFQGPQILYNTPERINPLEHTGNYSATWILRSWYTGHWWVGCYIWYSKEGTGQGRSLPRLLLAVPNVTAHPPTASVPITVLLYNGPLLCGSNVLIKGLNKWSYKGDQKLIQVMDYPFGTWCKPVSIRHSLSSLSHLDLVLRELDLELRNAISQVVDARQRDRRLLTSCRRRRFDLNTKSPHDK